MDPVSQAVFGAAAAQAVFGRKLPKSAWWIGALSGMAADLDVVVPVGGGATGEWLHHRGFTHGLAFAPVGGAVCAGMFLLLFKRLRGRPWAVLGACVLGYLTHAPLDALTTYGTQWFWPFTRHRVALDWMPIIDPVWTLTMITLVAIAAWRKSTRPAMVALAFAALYFGFGAWQHDRAVRATRGLAEFAGHDVKHLRATPTPLSLALWRGVWVDQDGVAHAAALRTGYLGLGRAQVRDDALKDAAAREVVTAADVPDTPESRQQFAVFNWFADGLVVAPNPSRPLRLVDGRYSDDNGDFSGLWGVDFSVTPPARFEPPTDFAVRRTLRAWLNLDGDYAEFNGIRGL